jgi:hypothetical protein
LISANLLKPLAKRRQSATVSETAALFRFRAPAGQSHGAACSRRPLGST